MSLHAFTTPTFAGHRLVGEFCLPEPFKLPQHFLELRRGVARQFSHDFSVLQLAMGGSGQRLPSNRGHLALGGDFRRAPEIAARSQGSHGGTASMLTAEGTDRLLPLSGSRVKPCNLPLHFAVHAVWHLCVRQNVQEQMHW